MKALDLQTAAFGLGAVALAGVALWFAARGVKGVASDLVAGTGEAAAGAVVGIGQIVGIPATNETDCQKAMREGRTWDASFACPASEFLAYVTGIGGKGAYGQ